MTGRPADPGLDADFATLRDALDTLSRIVGESRGPTTGGWYAISQTREGLDRVEALLCEQHDENARLREERDAALDREAGTSDAFDAMKADRDEYDAILGRRMAERDAAEARCARLQQALREIAEDEQGWATAIAREALAGLDTPADSQEDKT